MLTNPPPPNIQVFYNLFMLLPCKLCELLRGAVWNYRWAGIVSRRLSEIITEPVSCLAGCLKNLKHGTNGCCGAREKNDILQQSMSRWYEQRLLFNKLVMHSYTQSIWLNLLPLTSLTTRRCYQTHTLAQRRKKSVENSKLLTTEF